MFIGATPDGIVGQDLLVEIKCPYSAYGMPPENAIIAKKIKFWIYNERTGIFEINTNHSWYYQVQGQLEITNRRGCLLGVWTGAQFPVKVAYVLRRRDFWRKKMEDQLKYFYMNSLLPELVDPRHVRGMAIREPNPT